MDKEFAESYNTAEWQKTKNRILERDKYTCQICGSTTGVMQVHHITYKHCNGKAYNAPDEDLITLCCDCHNHDDGDHVHFFSGKYYWDSNRKCFQSSSTRLMIQALCEFRRVLGRLGTEASYWYVTLIGTQAEQEWIPDIGRTVLGWLLEKTSEIDRLDNEILKIKACLEDKYDFVEQCNTK